VKSGKSVKELLIEMDLGQVSDSSEIESIIMEVFEEEKQAVLDAKENPETVNYLVGKVMQRTHGKADPELTLTLLKKSLGIK
jgi:aspartyl-tRNA(Asn)/glutamyl-tRNA(Gln) amidotransferase subunit B